MKTFITLLFLFATTGALVSAEEAAAVTPYPLNYCIVSGEKLGKMGDPFTYRHGDREFKFCCRKCLKKFQADPGKYIDLTDKAVKSGKTDIKADAHKSHKHE